ncbi:cupin domain-containing protein [Microbacterium sp. SA39]|uniref:cupin domain-containing protein n=1 Tax=Microbacterium sp. SA39 TaxID=1263625 RepID=UPI0005FA883D|nr:cupin domain-containing protein [Microbacterium sp. SA39]KJQ55945.1 hypothetical protein RS85_00229 [Microbacterium sp. SA39]
MSGLAAGVAVDAAALALTHELLPAEEVVAGTPTTATRPLTTLNGVEIGIWEMTPGTATDIEIDEVFIVLAGRATISFASSGLPDLEVGPGSVVRLAEGMRTTWTVTETLRKVYVA